MAKPNTQNTRPKDNFQTGPKNVDWNLAFIDYCTIDFATHKKPTYKDISEKYGVAERNVEKIASREKWVKRRDEIGKQLQQDYKNNIKDLQDEANYRHGETWRMLQKSIRIEIAEIVDTQMRVRGNINPTKEDVKRLSYLSTKLEELSKALKEAINGERVTLMLYTDVSKQDGSQKLNFGEIDKSEIEAMDAFMAKNAHRIQNSSQNVQLTNEQFKPDGQETIQPPQTEANSNTPVSS